MLPCDPGRARPALLLLASLSGCTLVDLADLSSGTTGSGGSRSSNASGTVASANSATGSSSSGSGWLFDEEFDGDLGAFSLLGGTWAVTSSEARQTDDMTPLAYAYATNFTGYADYSIDAKVRLLSAPVDGGAYEINFRVDPLSGQQYFCNYEPTTGNFLVMKSFGGSTTVLGQVTVMPGDQPDMFAEVVFHLSAKGSAIHCELEAGGLPVSGATVDVDDTSIAKGSFGMKTYATGAAYDYIRVRAL